MDEDGRRADPALFQVARLRDGRIASLRDYRERDRALRAANRAA